MNRKTMRPKPTYTLGDLTRNILTDVISGPDGLLLEADRLEHWKWTLQSMVSSSRKAAAKDLIASAIRFARLGADQTQLVVEQFCQLAAIGLGRIDVDELAQAVAQPSPAFRKLVGEEQSARPAVDVSAAPRLQAAFRPSALRC